MCWIEEGLTVNRQYQRLISAGAVFIVTVFYLLYGQTTDAAFRSFGANVRVSRVHDGDTVSIILGRKREMVRLIGIDAPEMGQRPWGKMAKRHLEGILAGSGWTVTIEFDVQERDRYGRLLAYLWTVDGRLINLEMVRDGYAVVYTIPPDIKHLDALREGQRFARERRLGIWGKKGLREIPEAYRREHPR